MSTNSTDFSSCRCPCGGGQSCIVDRRSLGDWVHEDDVFKSHNLPVRKNCCTKFTSEQIKVMSKIWRESGLESSIQSN